MAAREAGCHLLIVRETTDVTYDSILNRIQELSAAQSE
jgi:hypothetical protein